ncbi:MAG: hypothetical protein WD036_06955 [Bauldia sp.]
MDARLGIALALALAVAAVAPLPAFAGDGMDCRCLYHGASFEQGDTICIRVDGRSRLARCEMLLNNSSWKFLSDGCPQTSLTPARPGLFDRPAAGGDLAFVKSAGILRDAAGR